jgi:hypothetical protein
MKAGAEGTDLDRTLAQQASFLTPNKGIVQPITWSQRLQPAPLFYPAIDAFVAPEFASVE